MPGAEVPLPFVRSVTDGAPGTYTRSEPDLERRFTVEESGDAGGQISVRESRETGDGQRSTGRVVGRSEEMDE